MRLRLPADHNGRAPIARIPPRGLPRPRPAIPRQMALPPLPRHAGALFRPLLSPELPCARLGRLPDP